MDVTGDGGGRPPPGGEAKLSIEENMGYSVIWNIESRVFTVNTLACAQVKGASRVKSYRSSSSSSEQVGRDSMEEKYKRRWGEKTELMSLWQGLQVASVKQT